MGPDKDNNDCSKPIPVLKGCLLFVVVLWLVLRGCWGFFIFLLLWSYFLLKEQVLDTPEVTRMK